MKSMEILRKLSVCVLLASIFTVANAQDIITKKSGDEIKSKVVEVGTNEVKYRRFGNDSGPVYTLQKSEIFMIKYENGEKDMFGNTGETTTRKIESTITQDVEPESAEQIRAQQPQNQQTQQFRKGYIGINIGGAFVTKSYDNISGGVEFSFNFGYLMTKNVGVHAAIFGTSFDLSNETNTSIGITGFLVGPLFTTIVGSGKMEFDLRPAVGFAGGTGTIDGTTVSSQEGGFAAGLGSSIRLNLSDRISLAVNVDYYNGKYDKVDLSSLGMGLGLNIRF